MVWTSQIGESRDNNDISTDPGYMFGNRDLPGQQAEYLSSVPSILHGFDISISVSNIFFFILLSWDIVVL